jgi:hypothetical protein
LYGDEFRLKNGHQVVITDERLALKIF